MTGPQKHQYENVNNIVILFCKQKLELTSFFNITIKVVIPRHNFNSSSSGYETSDLVILYATINSNDSQLSTRIKHSGHLKQEVKASNIG